MQNKITKYILPYKTFWSVHWHTHHFLHANVSQLMGP